MSFGANTPNQGKVYGGPEGGDFVMRPSEGRYWQESAGTATADTQSSHSEQNGQTPSSFMDEMGEAMRYDPDIIDKLKAQYPDRAEELERRLVWGGPQEGWLMRSEQLGTIADEGAQEGYVKLDLIRGLITFGGTNQRTTIAAANLAEKAIDHHVEASKFNPNGTTALAAPPRALPPAPVRPQPQVPVRANSGATPKPKNKENTKENKQEPRAHTPTTETARKYRRYLTPLVLASVILASGFGCSRGVGDGLEETSGSRDISNALSFYAEKIPFLGRMF